MAGTQEQAAQAAYAEDQKVLAESRAQYHERMKGKPTPTQKECDLIKLGMPIPNKEADGAGPEVVYTPMGMRPVEGRAASGGSGYTPRRPAPRPAPPQSTS